LTEAYQDETVPEKQPDDHDTQAALFGKREQIIDLNRSQNSILKLKTELKFTKIETPSTKHQRKDRQGKTKKHTSFI